MDGPRERNSPEGVSGGGPLEPHLRSGRPAQSLGSRGSVPRGTASGPEGGTAGRSRDRIFDMRKKRAEALIVSSSPFFYQHRTRLVELAAHHRLPTIYHQSEFVVGSGGLMSYGPDFHELFRRSATYVDRILKGAKPGDLPVQQPTKFELVINMKTAKALGLTIPQTLL